MADATKISLSEAYECLAAQIGHLAAADYLLRWGKEGVLDYYGRKSLRESRKKIKRREFTADLWIPIEPRLRDELLTEVNRVSYVVWHDVVMDRYQFERLRFERLPPAPAPAGPKWGSEIVDLEVAAAETEPLANQSAEGTAEQVPAKVRGPVATTEAPGAEPPDSAAYDVERTIEKKMAPPSAPAAPAEDGEAVLPPPSDKKVAPTQDMPKDKQPGHPAATDLALAAVEAAAVKKRTKRRGPKPGTIDRFGEAYRAQFPEITAIIEQQHCTAGEAARQLSNIAGRGSHESRARRLAERYRKEVEEPRRKKSKKLNETRSNS